MLVDIAAERGDPWCRVYVGSLGVGCGDGAAERIRQCFVDLAGEVIERALLVEALHLDRPLDRRARAADGELSICFPRDRHDATIDFRRVGGVHRQFGLAGGFALFQRRIIEKRKAHGALDLERAIAGEKHRCRMGIDAVTLAPPWVAGSARKANTAS